MIRFACPGCESQFTVPDEKAGKRGKCPKCQAEFTIPETTANDLPPPLPDAAASPPTSSESTPVEIEPCPGCGSRLSVAPGDLGTEIECPHCQMQYRARSVGSGSGSSKRLVDPDDLGERPSQRARQQEADDWERPSRRGRRSYGEDDDRPSRRSRRDEDEYEDRPSRRSRRDEDEDDFDRQPMRRNTMPGALQGVAIMLLVGAIQGLLLCIGWATTCFALLWPGIYYEIVWAILAIIRASQMLGKNDRKPAPSGLCIMQIICIVNLDVLNCILGIVGLVLLNQDDIKRYYSRRGRY